MSDAVAIELIKNEIKCLDSKRESNYDKIDMMGRDDLPSGASWDLSTSDIDHANDKIKEDIDSLEKTLAKLKY